MSNLKWFVASVRSCQERRVAEKLAQQGFETYVPTQKVKRKWSDRIKIIDKILLPGMVFIRCEEKQIDSIFKLVYGISYFLLDRTAETRKHLVVPDQQMEDFIRVVRAFNGESDLEFISQQIAKGDMVHVIRGPLTGTVCECAEVLGQQKLIIRVGMLGALLVEISASDVVKENL